MHNNQLNSNQSKYLEKNQILAVFGEFLQKMAEFLGFWNIDAPMLICMSNDAQQLTEFE